MTNTNKTSQEWWVEDEVPCSPSSVTEWWSDEEPEDDCWKRAKLNASALSKKEVELGLEEVQPSELNTLGNPSKKASKAHSSFPLTQPKVQPLKEAKKLYHALPSVPFYKLPFIYKDEKWISNTKAESYFKHWYTSTQKKIPHYTTVKVYCLLAGQRLLLKSMNLPIKKLAKMLEISDASVSRALKELCSVGILELVSSSYVPGVYAKRYKAVDKLASVIEDFRYVKPGNKSSFKLPTHFVNGDTWKLRLRIAAHYAMTGKTVEQLIADVMKIEGWSIKGRLQSIILTYKSDVKTLEKKAA